MTDYLNAAKVTLSAPIEDPEDYRGQSLSALACGVIAVAESLARIADALEAMKPQPVTIAEALKRPGVRSVDISAPSSGPLTHDGTGA